MDEDASQPQPEKPRFLLPDGCKDLIDALRLQASHAEDALSLEQRQQLPGPVALPTSATPPQGLPVKVTLSDPMLVRDLASALHLKPFAVIGSLMEFNIFATLNTALDFMTAARLCSHYGVAATKVA